MKIWEIRKIAYPALLNAKSVILLQPLASSANLDTSLSTENAQSALSDV